MIAATLCTPQYAKLCHDQVEHFRNQCDLPVFAIHLKEETFRISSGRKLELHRMFRGQKVLFFDADWRAIRKLDLDLLEELSETHFVAVSDPGVNDPGSFPKNDSKQFGIDPALYFNSGFFVANFALESHVKAFSLAFELYRQSKNGMWGSIFDFGEQSYLNAGVQKSGASIHLLPPAWNWFHYAWVQGHIEHVPREIIGLHAAGTPFDLKKQTLDAQTELFARDFGNGIFNPLPPHPMCEDEWFAEQGFSPEQRSLVNQLFSKVLEDAGSESNLAKTHPKLVEVCDWIQVVTSTAFGGGTTFPPAPFSFDEVMLESDPAPFMAGRFAQERFDLIQQAAGESGVLDHAQDPGQALVISFSSSGVLGMKNDFEFVDFLTERFPSANKLFLRDTDQVWYQNGVKGAGESIEKVAEFLKSKIAFLKPEKVICMGICGGGYAALLFGNLIEADHIVTFCPRTILKDPSDETTYKNWIDDVVRLGAYNDLGNLNFLPKTKITAFYGDHECSTYISQQRRLPQNSEIILLPGVNHEQTGRAAIESGQLETLLRFSIQ